MDRLVLRGSAIVPVLNMAGQLNDQDWICFPEKLNELHIPIPYVIGPFSDTVKSHDRDGQAFAKEVAAVTWITAENSEIATTQEGSLMDRVLPCTLTKGFSAWYLLDALSSEGRPSLLTAWADKSDPTYWVGHRFGSHCAVAGFLLVFGQCLRHMFELENEKKYNATSTMDLDRSFRYFLSDSKIDAVIGAIAQVASESGEEKGARQLRYLKERLLDIGQELECVYISSLPNY